MNHVLDLIDDRTLGLCFDFGTLSRGRVYAAQSRTTVEAMETRSDGLVIEGVVVGSHGEHYETSASLHGVRGQVRIVGKCSCPVKFDCKHVVSLILTARRQAAYAHLSGQMTPASQLRPKWQTDLDVVLSGLDAQPTIVGPRKKLALQFDLPRATRYGGSPRLVVRPLAEGARGNWVKTGIAWQHLRLASQVATYDHVQLEVMLALESCLGAAHVLDAMPLTAATLGLWGQLERARAAGIELVPAGSLTSIEIHEEPLSVSGDVVLRQEAHQLRLGLNFEDRHWSGDEFQLIGRPGHGAALLVPDRNPDPDDRRRTPAFRLVLARLEPHVPIALERILHDAGTVAVPVGQTDRFARDYLARLQAHLPITSSDGSIEVPEDVLPRLQVRVNWGSADEVELKWHFTFDVDGKKKSFALDSPSIGGIRRPAAEQKLLTELDNDLDEMSRGLLGDHRGRLASTQTLTDMWVLMFADTVLPLLRNHHLVDVVEEGKRPDYREAIGELEIEFDAIDTDADAAGGSPDWLDLSVVIRVDGESVPLPQVLAALTAEQEWVILPSGLHIATERPEFARLRELVTAAGELHAQDDDRLRVSRHDLGTWGELAELGVVDAQAAQWVAAAQALKNFEGLPDVELVGITSELRNYQHDGFRWLVFLWQAGLGGILADDMGLGKTLQTLALIAHARKQGAAPFLVVAPTSVMSAWAHEAATHAPGLDVRHIDASAARRPATLAQAVEGADLVVTSYTLFRLEAGAYAALEWGGMVLDEAQAIKNHQGKTYQAVRLMDVPFRLAVTGTPFENRLMEVWSLLSVVAPGLYPWPKRFREHVVKPVEKHADQQALDRFRNRIRPFVLRRTKDVVAADLPEKQQQILEVTLSPKHRKVYDTHLQRERQSILGLVEDFDRNRVAIFTALTRLRQLSLDAALVDPEHENLGSAKLDALVEHVSEAVAEGHRVLVFSQFTRFLKRARTQLDAAGIESRYLDGATRKRAAEIEAFRRGESGVFLISLKAGGLGLTLTEADYVFVLDPWWNPAAEAQAVDRAHRIGQTRPVMVYRLVATDTIEEKVMELKEKKAALFASVFSGDGAVGQGITDADVRSLFD